MSKAKKSKNNVRKFPQPISEEKVYKIIALRVSNVDVKEIATEVGVSEGTVYRYLRKYSDQIEAAKNLGSVNVASGDVVAEAKVADDAPSLEVLADSASVPQQDEELDPPLYPEEKKDSVVAVFLLSAAVAIAIVGWIVLGGS